MRLAETSDSSQLAGSPDHADLPDRSDLPEHADLPDVPTQADTPTQHPLDLVDEALRALDEDRLERAEDLAERLLAQEQIS